MRVSVIDSTPQIPVIEVFFYPRIHPLRCCVARVLDLFELTKIESKCDDMGWNAVFRKATLK